MSQLGGIVLSKPKIKACVLAMMLATPLIANAAGLGRLNVQSGLGQPFRGEIDLVSVAPDEADSLVVSLASPAAFATAQIQYPPPSLGLRLNIEKRAGGQYYVAVSSNQPISEPFLDLLVELNWANGHIQREYTALIDPVDYNTTRPSATAALPGRLSGKTPAPAPAATTPRPAAEQPSRPSRAAAAPQGEAGEQAGADQYRVKAGDTLSSIAGSVRPEGVNLDQVLVALYRNNQDAFSGNMNRLKRGKILRVPGRDEIAAIPRAEAAKEIRLQSENWRAYRQRVADAAVTGPSAEQGQSASGKISAQVEDKGTTQAENRDTLRLSKGVDKGGKGDAQARIRSLEEEAVARQKALTEANERVGELEKTVRDMEKMLAIKGQGKAVPTPTPTKVVPTPTLPPEPTAAPTPEPTPTQAAASAAAAVTASAAAAPVASEPASAPAKKKRRAPVQIEAPVEEESFLDSLLSNSMLLLGGAAVLVLGVGGLLWARRRRPAVFEDSIITGGDLKPNTVLGNTGGAVISTQPTENSFLTDFSRQGLGTIDTDEVDPIAEAEVYMAYGRDTQAEEILKDALSKDPTRNEIRMKLLEIYSARKDRTSFEEIAADLYASTNGHGPVWEQASYLGRNIDPENPLYARKDGRGGAPDAHGFVDTTPAAPLAAGAAVAAAAVAAPSAALDLDLGFDEPAPAPHVEPAPEPVPAPAADLNFDLDAFVVPEETGVPAQTGALDTSLELDVPAPAAAPEEFNDLDFNLDLDRPTLAEPAIEAAPEPAVTPAPVADFDLDISALTPSAEPPAGSEGIDLDFDFNLDDTAVPAATKTPAPPPIDLDQDTVNELDFSAEDPVQTKIDLARAYIDMGDVEGAREILQEALSEGNATQQGEARGLLDSL
ncbi:hypothetical protein GCM10007860_05140 [Chitiniphilus shinanonensis]|uniref:LysM domain-containing protein n=1 Tax=Chitiniphilus shinanonensis TaxID=553088 RepID=A0ABQ6BS64_9NEIS|nr:FimV/HubP family polar landmark protein [Chitiniphilus shinanonensis]GLS03371.1 hypothetical protein GCM10007860_05140 [Chitiniphilus shinanonensis]